MREETTKQSGLFHIGKKKVDLNLMFLGIGFIYSANLFIDGNPESIFADSELWLRAVITFLPRTRKKPFIVPATEEELE